MQYPGTIKIIEQYPWKVTVKDFILSKIAILQPAALLKNELFHRYFSKIFRNAIITNTFEWLFLRVIVKSYSNILTTVIEKWSKVGYQIIQKQCKKSFNSKNNTDTFCSFWIKMKMCAFVQKGTTYILISD